MPSKDLPSFRRLLAFALAAALAVTTLTVVVGLARNYQEALRPRERITREIVVLHPDELTGRGTPAERALRADKAREFESKYKDLIMPFYKEGRLISVIHADEGFHTRQESAVRLRHFILWSFDDDGKTARRVQADRGKYDVKTGSMSAHGNLRMRKYALPEGRKHPFLTPKESPDISPK